MIDLHELRDLLVKEIGKAETRVIESVKMSLARAKEDNITALFVVEAERGLKDATENGRIAAAVRSDLEKAYCARGCAPPRRLTHVTDGLVARLRTQSVTEEEETGGDFGLLLIEPHFQLRWNRHLDVYRSGLKRGLLVQAKRRLRESRWNQLTPTQVGRLSNRMAFAALLRYEFGDTGGKRLKSFAWHPLSGLRISDVVEWLRAGAFPDALSTSAIVGGLSRGEYGTSDQTIIEREICPNAGSYMVIEVDWKDETDLSDILVLVNREEAEEVVRQKVHIKVQE